MRVSTLLLLCASMACGPATEITIALEAAESADLSTLGALRVSVRELSDDAPEVFGPYEINRDEPERLAATVSTDSPFYVDVWGCVSTSLCTPNQLLARGCTDVITIPAGTQATAVAVVLDEIQNLPPNRCPPDSD